MTTTATITSPMPSWLVAKLDREGILDAATRLTRTAKHRRCTSCGLYVLAGLEDSAGARPIHADPLPTTSAGELFALLTGRPTYGLNAGRLYERDELQIAGRPADAHPTYVAHECHGPPLPVNPKFMPAPRPAITDDPPY